MNRKIRQKIVRLGELEKRLGSDRNVKVVDYYDRVLNFDTENIIDNKCQLKTLSQFLATTTKSGYTYHNEIVYSIEVSKDNYVLLKLERFNGYHNFQDVNGRR